MARARLRVLTRTLKVMALGALAIVILVLYQSLPRKSANLPQPTTRFDPSELATGNEAYVSWAGRPVLIVRRSDGEVGALPQLDPALLDPASTESEQPEGARNRHRSLEPGLFVALARGSGAGCPLVRLNQRASVDVQPWVGGYRDSCDGSLFDPAGRVYRRQAARRNLIVPPYHIDSGGQIVIGIEE